MNTLPLEHKIMAEEKNIEKEHKKEEIDETHYVQYAVASEYSPGLICSWGQQMRSRLETPIEQEYRILHKIKLWETDTRMHRVQYADSYDYEPGIVSSFVEMKSRLETKEEYKNRRFKEGAKLYKQVKKTDFNGGNYTIKGFKENGYTLVRCANEEHNIVEKVFENGTVIKTYTFTEMIKPDEPGYWEYANKKGLIEGSLIEGSLIEGSLIEGVGAAK